MLCKLPQINLWCNTCQTLGNQHDHYPCFPVVLLTTRDVTGGIQTHYLIIMLVRCLCEPSWSGSAHNSHMNAACRYSSQQSCLTRNQGFMAHLIDLSIYHMTNCERPCARESEFSQKFGSPCKAVWESVGGHALWLADLIWDSLTDLSYPIREHGLLRTPKASHAASHGLPHGLTKVPNL